MKLKARMHGKDDDVIDPEISPYQIGRIEKEKCLLQERASVRRLSLHCHCAVPGVRGVCEVSQRLKLITAPTSELSAGPDGWLKTCRDPCDGCERLQCSVMMTIQNGMLVYSGRIVQVDGVRNS